MGCAFSQVAKSTVGLLQVAVDRETVGCTTVTQPVETGQRDGRGSPLGHVQELPMALTWPQQCHASSSSPVQGDLAARSWFNSRG